MDRGTESRRPALKTEEAVLLPALCRSPFGAAALKSVCRDAEKIREKQTMEQTSSMSAQAEQGTAKAANAPRVRAALHHIQRR